jgi:hypothetical protein
MTRNSKSAMGAALRQISRKPRNSPTPFTATTSDFDVNQLVKGTVLRIEGEEVLVDIGYKSEGIVHLSEWGPDERGPSARRARLKSSWKKSRTTSGSFSSPSERLTAPAIGSGSSPTSRKTIASLGTVVRKIKGGCWSTSPGAPTLVRVLRA